jgi:hypothetical protein
MAQPDREQAETGGASQESEDLRLLQAAQTEIRRLATHPMAEAHRLREEAREGEHGSTMLILVGGMAIWLWLLAGAVIACAFLIGDALAR